MDLGIALPQELDILPSRYLPGFTIVRRVGWIALTHIWSSRNSCSIGSTHISSGRYCNRILYSYIERLDRPILGMRQFNCSRQRKASCRAVQWGGCRRVMRVIYKHNSDMREIAFFRSAIMLINIGL